MTIVAESGFPADADLFEAYQSKLLRVVSSVVKASRHTVEDACAFAWLQFLIHRPERNQASWLVRVAVREAWRLTAEEWRVAADDRATRALASHALEGDERIVWVDGAVSFNRLDESERRLLLMAAAGYSYKEIGDLLGHTRRAVERRLKRARAHLVAAADHSARRPTSAALACAAP